MWDMIFNAGHWFSGRALGAAVLIAVVAFVVGYGVSKVWPKAHNPQLFGALAALALVGGLAAAGSGPAALAIVILFMLGALAFMGAF
jgi:hypothetical protein